MSPYSLCFSCDGLKLYSGYKNDIRVFDTTRPGQKCQTRSIFAKGICLEFVNLITCIFILKSDYRITGFIYWKKYFVDADKFVNKFKYAYKKFTCALQLLIYYSLKILF